MAAKNLLKILSVTLLAGGLISAVSAEEGYQGYASIDAGYGSAKSNLKSAEIVNTTKKDYSMKSFVGGASFGYFASPEIRTEISLQYNPGESNKYLASADGTEKVETKARTLSAIFNIYRGFSNMSMAEGNIEPFVGLGFGIDHNDLKAQTYKDGANAVVAAKTAKGAKKIKPVAMLHAGLMGYLGNKTAISVQGSVKNGYSISGKANTNTNKYKLKRKAGFMGGVKLVYLID